jgi:hypothetical protein
MVERWLCLPLTQAGALDIFLRTGRYFTLTPDDSDNVPMTIRRRALTWRDVGQWIPTERREEDGCWPLFGQ